MKKVVKKVKALRVTGVVDKNAVETPAEAAEAPELEWSNPPSKSNARGPSAATVALREALAKRPGEWARVKAFDDNKAAVSYATGLRKSLGVDFKVVQRGLEVYAQQLIADEDAAQ